MRAWIFFAFVLALQTAAVLLQSVVPFFPEYRDFRPLLFPLFFCFGALALPFGQMLILAFCMGFSWDILNTQFFQIATETGGMHRVAEVAFGWPILLYGLLAFLLHGFRPFFVKGRWDVYCLACGVSTILILFTEYIVITFNRGGLIFPPTLWPRILLPGLVNLVLAPFVFLGFRLLAFVLSYPLFEEAEEVGTRTLGRTTAR